MKHLLSIILACVLVVSCDNSKKETAAVNQTTYTITGSAAGIYNGIRAQLKVKADRGKYNVVDEVIVMNNAFEFTGSIDSPEMVYLFVNSVKGNLPLILENQNITINVNKDNLAESKISGSRSNDALTEYNAHVKELSTKRYALSASYRTAVQNDDKAEMEKINPQLEVITKEMVDYPYDFIAENNDNFFVVSLIETLVNSKKPNLPRLEKAYNSLEPNIKNSPYGVKVKTEIAALKLKDTRAEALEIGKPAPKFTAPNTQGEMIALDDVLGDKVTVIDFWASWCGPCRRENPNVVKIYEKYKDQGLEIIGVSLDKKGQVKRWEQAIKKDQLTWPQVSNLKFWKEPVALLYGVRSIPATFILDKDGNIVAKNLRGERLEEKIAELVK